MDYLVVDQTDLDIYFDWLENLANYTGEMHYYLQSAGTSSSTSVVSTISTQTTSLSYALYELRAEAPIFTAEGLWVVWSEIVSSSSRWRASEPIYVEFKTKGMP